MDDLKTFTNPTVYWCYYGTFSVELTADANKDILPKNQNNSINGNMTTIKNGRIKEGADGIQLRDSSWREFYWAHPCIICFRDNDGKLLWVNDNYR